MKNHLLFGQTTEKSRRRGENEKETFDRRQAKGGAVLKFLQRLGRSLMLPVACLPVCGILMGIVYLLSPASMQGGESVGVPGAIGGFLTEAGGAIIDNIAILFAVGVGIGVSRESSGHGALSALTAWLTVTALLSPDAIALYFPSWAEDVGRTAAFEKIRNPFIGILCGLIGAFCCDRFGRVRLPAALSFFGGKRFAAIASAVSAILMSLVLLFLWPATFSLLTLLGSAIASLGAAGAGIYAFLNRLLIPTGLHHALNNVFWFDTAGLGDLTYFWQGATDADVSWSLGSYMSGFFPCIMFGVPGAAAAMIRSVPKEKRRAAFGLLASGALCAFISGVTEPFEFAFMFLSPGLYTVYALLYGIFTYVTVALGFRAGFSFSAGLVDLIFSSRLPAAQKTWLIIPLGLAAFAVFYGTFFFIIKRYRIKVPGSGSKETKSEERNVTAENNLEGDSLAKKILSLIGGKENIVSVGCCTTRLRIEVKNEAAVERERLLFDGVKGVVMPGGGAVQIVIGPNVEFILEDLKKLLQ